MFNLVFRDDANTDIKETVAYYNLLQEGLADAFLEELGTAIRKLEASPQSYSYLNAKIRIRFLLLKKFRFNIVFEIIGDEIVIYSVRHTKRSPFA